MGFWSHYILILKKKCWLTIIYVKPKQLNYKAGCKFWFASKFSKKATLSSIIDHAQHGFQASLRICLSSLPTILIISAIQSITTRATTILAIRAEGWLLPVHVSECGGHCSRWNDQDHLPSPKPRWASAPDALPWLLCECKRDHAFEPVLMTNCFSCVQ